MLKNILNTYTSGLSNHINTNVESIDKSIEALIFNNKLLIKVSYNNSSPIILNLRCHVKFIYYLDMILKLLNVVDIDNDDNKFKFTINGKYPLNNNYTILTNFNIHDVFLEDEVNETNLPIINIQKAEKINISDTIVSIDQYDIKNKYRLDFFESWRQANYIMFKHSKNILKLNVQDSNDLWTSFFIKSDFESYNDVITKNNLINLNERIPVRAIYKTASEEIILRQPSVETNDTLHNVIVEKLEFDINSRIIIQGFNIHNFQFTLKNLYQNFHSPDGFLYIVVVI
ncbi:hypothetical protein HANVADRAFT_1213 [Hanseniaspora valbyensis NRRL Y-1626]|uniref:Autophagy protein 5 n=1 Tax=Hanseniaspora valbyensis NRRL Y-1626 TaxID=766949 RepID=A0A1B7THA9_9ASCO|nr:hypothetical protein HANVADRAFT_1213 [Hanseniaspora valbyensis NRRL Y-1626]